MLERTIRASFDKKCGRMKPLNGLSLGPSFDSTTVDLKDEYKELGVPFVRTSASRLPVGEHPYLDISSVFPDPALDERFPESYDFSLADRRVADIRASGAAVILSVGEHKGSHSRFAARPSVSAEKWARIVERIILHYNRGWGQGFKYSIKMLEIWPGADLEGAFFGGVDAFCEFYRTVATYLKGAFPTLKIGGYSAGGFTALNRYDASPEEHGYLAFLDTFLERVGSKAGSAPLDFFTWRCRAESAEELALHTNYARNYLAQYGLRRTVSVIGELSVDLGGASPALSRDYPALLAAILAAASDTDVAMMLSAIPHPYSCDNGVITVDDCCAKHRYSAYGVLAAYGELLGHGVRVDTTENFRKEIYAVAAASERGGALMIATGNYSGRLCVELSGSRFSSYSIKGMLGGGPRGEGFSTEERDIPLGGGSLTMKVGRAEVYLITLS